ncbi:MAG: class SAM-dependent methyltransferase [Candidatus Eremiobacteraeota bacterium]|nr:class SAM-dependent methyltransferase [Candidatus Eremiobacteraeota bacterium]
MTADRRDRILSDLNLAGAGLEIGGGYNPITCKDEFRVDHLDHADRDTLIEKFASQGIDTSRIQTVDYVWSGQTYAELVGEKRYDWIIASHVIEHVPNPIQFLNDCTEILTEDGILSLVVPDKRFCFDYYRPPSGLARLIDAFVAGDTRTTAGSVVEHIMYAATVNGAITWDLTAGQSAPKFLHTAEQARSLYDSIAQDGAFHDVHAWAFTPASFRLVAEDLNRLGLISLRERSWHDTEGYEFYVQLSRQGDGPNVARATLAKSAISAWDGDSEQAADRFQDLMSSTVSARSRDLVELARSHSRGEIIVQGTSGHPQIYLIRDGRRHAIASPAWIIGHGYAAEDVIVVDDAIIFEVAEGEILVA